MSGGDQLCPYQREWGRRQGAINSVRSVLPEGGGDVRGRSTPSGQSYQRVGATSGGDQLHPVSSTRGWGRRQGAINSVRSVLPEVGGDVRGRSTPSVPETVGATSGGDQLCPYQREWGRRQGAINSVRSVLPEGGGDVRGRSTPSGQSYQRVGATSGGDQLRPVSPTRGWGRRQGAINSIRTREGGGDVRGRSTPSVPERVGATSGGDQLRPYQRGWGRRQGAINSVRTREGGGDVRGRSTLSVPERVGAMSGGDQLCPYQRGWGRCQGAINSVRTREGGGDVRGRSTPSVPEGGGDVRGRSTPSGQSYQRVGVTSGGDQLRPVSPTRGWGRHQRAINSVRSVLPEGGGDVRGRSTPSSQSYQRGWGRRQGTINSVWSVLPEGGDDVRGRSTPSGQSYQRVGATSGGDQLSTPSSQSYQRGCGAMSGGDQLHPYQRLGATSGGDQLRPYQREWGRRQGVINSIRTREDGGDVRGRSTPSVPERVGATSGGDQLHPYQRGWGRRQGAINSVRTREGGGDVRG